MELKKETVFDRLIKARRSNSIITQPRCGVAGMDEMEHLLCALEREAHPEILSLSIDSYTRNKDFEKAKRCLKEVPFDLNGFPLVSHGWENGRQLNESIGVPLQIRHGSPDAITLFRVALASGITAFEGGGISYNLPYAKNVPLRTSLRAWEVVDCLSGKLATEYSIIVDRELFGTLTGLLTPPSLAIAVAVLEAILATLQGVRCISVAYPESGNAVQDVAALRSISDIVQGYLKNYSGIPDAEGIHVFPVLHQYMGPFPQDKTKAEQLISQGALTATWGGATKLVTKTPAEAICIPSTEDNINGLRTAKQVIKAATNCLLDASEIVSEQNWIKQEVKEILAPVLEMAKKTTLLEAIISAFDSGLLDIPFAPSVHTKGKIMPSRDANGAIRYLKCGGLALSEETQKRHGQQLRQSSTKTWRERINRDLFYFAPESQMCPDSTNGLIPLAEASTKKIILMVTKSDAHVVGNQVLNAMLEEMNHEVINLGACSSLEELKATLLQQPDVDLIAIGNMNGHALADLEGLATLKQELHLTCPIVLGGNISIHGSLTESQKSQLHQLGIDKIIENRIDGGGEKSSRGNVA